MQLGNLPTSDVIAYTSRVLVNGVQREFSSWDVSRDLPANTGVGQAKSGFSHATGNVEWSNQGDVTTTFNTPFNRATGWSPSEGDRVEIFCSVSGLESEWKVFHGRIDKSWGNDGSTITSAIVDDVDRLSGKVSHLAMLRVMPPMSPTEQYRGVGLSSLYYLDAALRSCGYYTTPAPAPNTALCVPCQGSMWPDRGVYGTARQASGLEPGISHGRNFEAPWGLAVGNFRNIYEPRIRLTASRPLQISVCVSPNHAGDFKLEAFYDAERIRLAIWASRSATAYLGDSNIVSLSSAQLVGATIITLLIKGSRWELRANNGVSASGNATITSQETLGNILVEGADKARVAGIVVSHPDSVPQEFMEQRFIPNTRLRTNHLEFNGLMDAGLAINQRSALDVIEEICSATLSAAWIDELGTVQWSSALGLEKGPTVAVLTSLDSITALSWESQLLSTSSAVTVKGQNPAVSTSKWNSIELYRTGSTQLDSEDVIEEIVEPDSNTGWIMPDESIEILDESNWSLYNAGRGTYGGVFFTSEGEYVERSSLDVAISMDTVSQGKYKIRHQAGVFPPGVAAQLATSPTAASLWPRNRDKPLPVVRGAGKFEMFDVSLQSEGPGGQGPEYVHEAGQWNNRMGSTAQLSGIASYLTAKMTVPPATIPSMEVIPDPRLQLGDKVSVSSVGLLGAELQGLISGISLTFAPGTLTQNLKLDVLTVSKSFETYASFNGAATESYEAWQSAAPGYQTYAEFDNNQEV